MNVVKTHLSTPAQQFDEIAARCTRPAGWVAPGRSLTSGASSQLCTSNTAWAYRGSSGAVRYTGSRAVVPAGRNGITRGTTRSSPRVESTGNGCGYGFGTAGVG